MPPLIPKHHQHGVTLLIGMILLLILTLGATSLMNSTIMDERMTGNIKASTDAFFAAEKGQKDTWKALTADKDQGYPSWKALYANVQNLPENNTNAKVDVNSGNISNLNAQFNVIAQYKRDPDGNIIPGKFRVLSNGQSGNSLRTVVMDLDGSPPSGGFPPAPAAISCFGGACNISAGAAQDAPISGQDHPVPPENCNGTGNGHNSCDMSPNNPNTAIVPAVYFSDFDASEVSTQSNGNGNGNGNDKLAFTGLSRFNSDDPNNSAVASGNTKEQSGAVWGSSHYPQDENGEATHPKDSDFAGDNAAAFADIYSQAASADSTLGNISSPKVASLNPAYDNFSMPGSTAAGVLVVEGTDSNGLPSQMSNHGTGAFVGLIIIRDCNQVNFGGNFSIYGAIVVDATDCGDNYLPFLGNGTPDVKYSTEAFNIAGSGVGSGDIGDYKDWYEVINY